MDLPGVGVDIETVRRFQTVSDRLFTPGELQHAGDRLESKAGIWCAKEAVVKAVAKWRLITVREVEIRYQGDRPTAVVDGFNIELSISHTPDYAVAMAIAEPTK